MLTPVDLDVRWASAGDTLTLTLRGELDIATVPVLERELADPRLAGFTRLVIDLGALDFIDSSGLHLLIRAQRESQARQQRLSLRAARGPVRRLFELTRSVDFFTFED